MGNILHQSLGLDKVEGDLNALPDGAYDGEVFKSVLVYVDSKDTISHVITYKVSDGDYKGRQRDEWFTLGREPRLKDGSTPTKGEVPLEDLGSFTPTMSEQAKPWYKKRHLDLGFTEDQFAEGIHPSELTGKPVTFRVKTKDGYSNVNSVWRRDTDSEGTNAIAPDASTSGAVSLDF